MRFADVIGQDYVKGVLRRSVDDERVGHAQMLAGRCGTGTLALALAYVQYLNCTDRHDGDSCGCCPACLKIQELVHPDVHFVFPTNSAGAQKTLSDDFLPRWREALLDTGGYLDEQMWYARLGLDNKQGLIAKREADEIIRKLSFKPFEAKYKCVVLWLPEKMGTEAANGLLKILEEPWDNTLFLLVSQSPQQLLPTIISRVQTIDVPPIDAEIVEKWLADRGSNDTQKNAALARLSGGDLIEADRLTARDNDDVESGDDFDNFVSLMRLCYGNRHLELFDWAENMAAQGREAQKRFLNYTASMLRASFMLTSGLNDLSYLWGRELEFCMKFAPYVHNLNIEELIDENRTALSHITQNGNAKLIFTHYALSVSKLIGRPR